MNRFRGFVNYPGDYLFAISAILMLLGGIVGLVCIHGAWLDTLKSEGSLSAAGLGLLLAGFDVGLVALAVSAYESRHK